MSNSIGIITESLAFLSSPSRSFSRFGRIGTRTIAPSRLSGSIRRRWTRWCSPTTNFRGASFTASIAGFAFSRIPATQAGGTCVVRSVAAGTAAGNALTSGAPRTTARQRADGRRNAATPVASASRCRRPRRRRISRRRISSNRRRRPAPLQRGIAADRRTAVGRRGARRIGPGDFADAALREDAGGPDRRCRIHLR